VEGQGMVVPPSYLLDARRIAPPLSVEARKFEFWSENRPTWTRYLKASSTSRNLPRGSSLAEVLNFVSGENNNALQKGNLLLSFRHSGRSGSGPSWSLFISHCTEHPGRRRRTAPSNPMVKRQHNGMRVLKCLLKPYSSADTLLEA